MLHKCSEIIRWVCNPLAIFPKTCSFLWVKHPKILKPHFEGFRFWDDNPKTAKISFPFMAVLDYSNLISLECVVPLCCLRLDLCTDLGPGGRAEANSDASLAFKFTTVQACAAGSSILCQSRIRITLKDES